jgi:hypothetical protein
VIKVEETVEISERKAKDLERQPVIENSWFQSTDKKWLVHKTTITDIKPMAYMEKVLGGN